MYRHIYGFQRAMLIALMVAILVACSSTAAPASPVASAPTTIATIEPASEEPPTVESTVTEQPSTEEQPTDEPAVEEQPTAEPTVAEQQTAVPASAEQPTEATADGSTPPLELTWDGAAATLRDMLATFGKGDISKFLSTKLRAELATSRSTDEALGLYEVPLQSFEVRDALNEPTEVLLVPATLQYAEFEEERLYEMVVEDGQWRVTGSGKVSATGNGMNSPAPEATQPAGTTRDRVLYIRFDYERQGADLHSVGTDGSDDRRIFSCVEPCGLTGLAISPTHDEIAFTSHGQGETQSLYITQPDGTVLHRIQGNMLMAAQAWSPDGERLAYVQSRATGDAAPVEATAVFVVDRKGNSLQLTDWAYFTQPPVWLDNQQLLFSQGTTGTPPSGWRTYRVDASGNKQVEPVTDGEIVEVSPDRRHLLVMLETLPNQSSQRSLTLVPLNGGESQPIAHNLNASAAWAPDGASFVFFDPGAGALMQVQIRDMSRTELRFFEQNPTIPFVRMAWAPDGKNLYYTHTHSGANKTEIHRHQIETGDNQVIAEYGGDPQPLVILP